MQTSGGQVKEKGTESRTGSVPLVAIYLLTTARSLRQLLARLNRRLL